LWLRGQCSQLLEDIVKGKQGNTRGITVAIGHIGQLVKDLLPQTGSFLRHTAAISVGADTAEDVDGVIAAVACAQTQHQEGS
jgi:hypothetical protein